MADLDVLQNAWKDRKLVLFLGAGVSIPHGIPNWNDLVLELLMEQTSRFDGLWPHYRTALGSWMSDSFDFTPVSLSRVFKKRVAGSQQQNAYLERIRTALYRKKATAVASHDSLAAIVRLIRRSEKAGRRIPAVITSNFDDLLEQQLRAAGVATSSIYDGQRHTESTLRILHVHGFLPKDGAIPPQEIVFAEDEYHRLTYTFFHWALSELVSFMRNYTILFIGFFDDRSQHPPSPRCYQAG